MSFHLIRSQRVLLRVTSADILESIRVLNTGGIAVYQFICEEALTANMEIERRDLEKCRAILDRRGDIVRIQRNPPIPLVQYLLTKRLLLTIGLAIGCMLLFFLPTRILFVAVEGNQAIPAKAILEAADTAGIRLLASRRAVRSEKVKNALLSQIPQLQWAGVNTYGCRAVISVQERIAPEPVESQGKIISSIIASQDGIIQSATALAGSLSCREGQAVQKGQILISGYTDCGLCIRATRASGEIYAKTSHTLSAVTPGNVMERSEGMWKNCFSLVLGKKRIKLWKDSGIWDSTCGRIYREYPLRLPGKFTLPISLACDILLIGPMQETPVDSQAAEKMLRMDCGTYLKSQMIAGTIQERNEVFSNLSDLYLLSGKYECEEMIGRERLEKIGNLYGKNS